jgi:hypothetical protein
MDRPLPRTTSEHPTEPRPEYSKKKGAAWLLPVLLLSCTSEPSQPPASTGDPKPPQMQPAAGTPENVIDRLVVPLLRTGGREPTQESPEVLCRRLSIDLNGIAPSAAEVTQRCIGRTPAQMVHYFMNKPQAVNVPGGEAPYVYVGRRFWSEIFAYRVIEYDLNTTFYADVLELDGLVKKLYEGTLSYDRFATEALIAPAFLRRFGFQISSIDTSQTAAAAVRIFLGREALPSDAVDLGSLWRPFAVQNVGPTQARAKYPECIYCTHYAITVRNGACAGNEALLCQSTALGPIRLGPLTAPTVPTPGLPARPGELTGATATELRRIGELFVKRREFAEAIVDRVLVRYLGWWASGVYRPDYELPAVRDALVDHFIKGGYKLRELEREVLTSVLYTQAAALRAGDIAEAPLWAHGPTKQLLAEPYLDTLAAAAGVDLGGCDFRFAAGYNAQGVFDQRTRPSVSYTFPVTPGFDAGTYVSTARKLGGCAGGAEKGEPAGLVAAQAKREALLRICNSPQVQATLVPKLEGLAPAQGLPKLLDHQLQLIFGRPATSPEKALWLMSEPEACAGGRCDYKQVGSQLCMALFGSSTVNFY